MFFGLVPSGQDWRAYSFAQRLAAFSAAFIFLAVLALGSFTALKYGQAIGSDIHYHLQYSLRYASGHLAFLDQDLAAPNGGPYPPLFHLLFVPFIWLGLQVPFSALLEATVLFFAFLATFLLAGEKKGLVAASFAVVLLFSSRAFFDRTQVTPQAIDAIAMPLAVLFFFRRDYKWFFAGVAAMAYSHGAYGLLLFAPFVVFSMVEAIGKQNRVKKGVAGSPGLGSGTRVELSQPQLQEERLSQAVKAGIIVLPVVFLVLAFLPGFLGSGLNAVHNPQDMAIRSDPLVFFEYFGQLPAAFAGLSLIFLSRNMDDEFSRFLLVWLLCLLPMAFFFPDRLASYSAQPFSIMAGSMLAKITEKKPGACVFFLLALAALGFWLNYWVWLQFSAKGLLITLSLTG